MRLVEGRDRRLSPQISDDAIGAVLLSVVLRVRLLVVVSGSLEVYGCSRWGRAITVPFLDGLPDVRFSSRLMRRIGDELCPLPVGKLSTPSDGGIALPCS